MAIEYAAMQRQIIATILNITQASVKISRNHPRKALALDSHADIAQFLITL